MFHLYNELPFFFPLSDFKTNKQFPINVIIKVLFVVYLKKISVSRLLV